MYIITNVNGIWHCECLIQDGTERWTEPSKEKAVQSMIRAARLLNHAYIREDDIKIIIHPPQVQNVKTANSEELEMLERIRRGTLKVISRDDPLLKYRITEEDCETIVSIREGKFTLQRVD